MAKIVTKYKYQIIIGTMFLSLILGILLYKWISIYIDKSRIENYYSINESFVSVFNHIEWVIEILPAILLTWFVIKFIIPPCEKKAAK
jgi:hypothetical protein